LTGIGLTKSEVARLEQLLDHGFGDRNLLLRAVTHASAVPQTASYERLEFLGDRVLGLVLAEYFHKSCPDDNEGALSTRLHAAARQSTLAQVARQLELAPLVRAQTGMDVVTNESVLSDVVESLLAALYLDGGYEPVRRFVVMHWPLDLGLLEQTDKDAKSRLQELAMKRGLALPRYRLVSRSGTDHEPQMVYAVEVDGHAEQQASGASRKQAQQKAAAQLIALMIADNDGRQ
jgi:ribonuclease-3